MLYTLRFKRLATAALLLMANLALNACAGFSSPMDQAIYTGGDDFGLKDYSRTIFSSSNF